MPKKSPYPDELVERARAMKDGGYTLGQIAQQLCVPKPTVQCWCNGTRRFTKHMLPKR